MDTSTAGAQRRGCSCQAEGEASSDAPLRPRNNVTREVSSARTTRSGPGTQQHARPPEIVRDVWDHVSMRSVAEVHLRDVLASDLPVHFEHQSDPESARLSVTDPHDRAAFEAHWTKILGDSTGVVQTIVADGEVVGSAFCWVQDDKREVGYRIGQGHWGKGIATAALFQLLAEVTERPLYATVAAHNPASRRVLEKCGFRQVAVERAGEATMHVMRLD